MDISALKRDSAAIASGQWVDQIPGMGNIRIKVRGFSSPEVVEARSRKERAVPLDQRHRDGSLRAEVANAIFVETLSDAAFLDIEGLTAGGKPVTADEARKLLTDPDYGPLADAVAWAASAVDKGTAEATEELAKN